jgi:2-phosphosulfolactate phosphatase
VAYTLNVYGLPHLVEPEDLAGGAVVIIDVLRSSTTIVHALEAGASEVIPCLEVDEARQLADRLPRGKVILGGERNGLRIDGFELGNSPAEYSPHQVGGKTIVFTSTNGTRAMARARQAGRILIGAFVNVTAVARRLLGQQQIHLLCAGTRGQIGQDDLLLAGLLVERLCRQAAPACQQNAQAVSARQSWLQTFAVPQALGQQLPEPQRLAQELRKSPGGKNLLALGLEEDILAAAQIDRFDSVPELDPQTFHIRLT